ncbi:hypothetical protein [Nocardioides piscis]|uniref:Uncharacterized protein n=1 Tax=Nocardioides piscis TaxID=2714938 RepID=A0A6G7YGR1_9ACTN|nr:hypothetical protein [Nocardioides piscis]QIK75821.1 hypothetical protein G7071_10575 [Nocardioides piscis]
MSSVFMLRGGGESVTALGSTCDVKTDGAHSAVAEIGEEELLADPERLAALACGVWHGHPGRLSAAAVSSNRAAVRTIGAWLPV